MNQPSCSRAGMAAPKPGLLDRLRANGRKSKPGLSSLFFFVLLFWAAITSFLTSEWLAQRAIQSILTGPEGEALSQFGGLFLLHWLIGSTLAVLIGGLKSRGQIKTWWQTCAKPGVVAGMVMALMAGLVGGQMVFTATQVRTTIAPTLELFDRYSLLQETIPTFRGDESQTDMAWFDPTGQLKDDRRQAWCDQSGPAIRMFVDGGLTPRAQNQNLHALLSNSVVDVQYFHGCLDDAQWLARRADIYETIVGQRGPDSAVNQALRWSPILGMMGKTESVIQAQAMPSPANLCVKLVGARVNPQPGADLYEQCRNSLPTDRMATLEDLVSIRASIEKWSQTDSRQASE